MSKPATVLGDPEDAVLWSELAEVAERINRHDADLARRTALYEDLRDRGYMLKEIARVASTGRDEPLTDKAVSFTLSKAKQERAGTWDPKRTTKGRRRTRR